MRRFREQKGSNPKFLRFVPNWNPSYSRKSKVRHLPFVITLFAKTERTKEELDVDEEKETSSRAFVLCSCMDSLVGRFPKAIIGSIGRYLEGGRRKESILEWAWEKMSTRWEDESGWRNVDMKREMLFRLWRCQHPKKI